MKRVTDDEGRARNGLLIWEHAKAKAEREALPFEVIAKVARQEAQRRMAFAKLAGKPRVSIHPFRNGEGHWYTITAGSWTIRCKSWYALVFRAAYGPWRKLPVQYTESRHTRAVRMARREK